MIGRPDVSIVMANYNGAQYLPAAINSILRQSLTSWELILVDDASSDDSIITATRAAAGDPRIRVVAQPVNRGPAAARNRALEAAKGRWIAIVDSDDLLHRQRLETLLRRATRDGAAIIADNMMVFSEMAAPRPFLRKSRMRGARWVDLPEFIESNCLYTRTPDLGFLKPLIRADVIHGLRYDESLRIGEDYHFVLGLMVRGRRLRLEPACLYFYRKHQSSISYRMRSDDIERLREADALFAQSIRIYEPRLDAALRRRRETLLSLLTYERVIAALKRRDFPGAATLALGRPHIWPLLARPIASRFDRIRSKLTAAMGVDRRSIDEAQLQHMLLKASASGAAS